MKIERNRKRARNVMLKPIQLLALPQHGEFELTELLRMRGTETPTNHQFHATRQWLTENNYIKSRIQGRKEFWIYEPNLSDNERANIKERFKDSGIWTVDKFIAHHFPGLSPPRPREELPGWHKRMRAHGLVPRMDGLYWSQKLARRAPAPPSSDTPVKQPNYIKIPKGSFSFLEFLDFNKMEHSQVNVGWAKLELKRRGVHKIPGSHRYAKADACGRFPASITGVYTFPGSVFTTYEFQRHNSALKPTAEEWQQALACLQAAGYSFDPKWKRWRKM